MSEVEGLRTRVRELEFENCFVPQESSTSEDDNEPAFENNAEFIEAMFVPPQQQLMQKVFKKKQVVKSELLSRADFEMPDLYERIKVYMKMLFDFVRTHPKIKGRSNERNFSFVLRRAINVLNDMVRVVAPTGNYVVIEQEEGTKYSKLWLKLVKIISFMLDYDGAFEVLAKTYAYYNKRPVRHSSTSTSLRSLAGIFFTSTPTLIKYQETGVAPAPDVKKSVDEASTKVEEPEFKPKLSAIEFGEINRKLTDLHEFLVGASVDRKKAVNMTRFNESAENDPWVHKKKSF